MRYFSNERETIQKLRNYAEKILEMCDQYERTGEISEIQLLDVTPGVPNRVHMLMINLQHIIGVILIEKYDKRFKELKWEDMERIDEMYIHEQSEVSLFLKIDDTEDGFYRSQLNSLLEEAWSGGIKYAKYLEKMEDELSGIIFIPDQKCPWSLGELLEEDAEYLIKGLK